MLIKYYIKAGKKYALIKNVLKKRVHLLTRLRYNTYVVSRVTYMIIRRPCMFCQEFIMQEGKRVLNAL